ncbi:hypothetical protein [Rhizobium sp. IMFF44]|uniref:hypothetical protein n=1 Tax=Rhizobium sp. IMFF44 TaxID=3342350 RepID=UPI0035B9360A
MHSFGKLTSKVETHELENGQPAQIYVFYDEKGTEWHDLFRSMPAFDFYVALDDRGRVISMEPDPEHSQIEGHQIIGISKEESGGFSRGPGGSVYGKQWRDGKISEPLLSRDEYPTLTPRQLWLAAASINVTKEDVLAKVAEMPDRAASLSLQIELTETVNFERSNPAIDDLASLLGIPADQLDALWLWAAEL